LISGKNKTRNILIVVSAILCQNTLFDWRLDFWFNITYRSIITRICTKIYEYKVVAIVVLIVWYLCWWLSTLKLWVRILLMARYTLYNIICDKVCQMTCSRSVVFSGYSSTNKTEYHDISEILLKVALDIITVTPIYTKSIFTLFRVESHCSQVYSVSMGTKTWMNKNVEKSHLLSMTRFCNNLYQVHSLSKDWLAKII